MNIALVDDDAGDRLRLEQLLKEYGTIHGLDLCIDQFSDAEAFLRGYESFRYAVIFLDIYMDGLSGIKAAREIRKVDDDAKLVFLTSSESHRADAFDLFAVSYLGKPCAQEQVFRTLDHILRLRTDGEKRFSFSYNRQSFSLLLGEIVSLETEGNYLVIADCQGRTYRTRMTFFVAMKQLDSRFMELRQKDGAYLSTNRKGSGVGLSSVISTAESYGGVAQFSHKGKEFYSNVAIPLG